MDDMVLHYRGDQAPHAGRPGMRVRWRHSRTVLKEGLEAALRADPRELEKCTPKTGYGLIVRGLVLEAGKSKATPLKTVMSLIGRNGEDDSDDDDGESVEENRRDWSPEGVWETTAEATPANQSVEETEGPARTELKRRLARLVEAGDHEHVARIVSAIRSGRYSEPEAISTA